MFLYVFHALPFKSIWGQTGVNLLLYYKLHVKTKRAFARSFLLEGSFSSELNLGLRWITTLLFLIQFALTPVFEDNSNTTTLTRHISARLESANVCSFHSSWSNNTSQPLTSNWTKGKTLMTETHVGKIYNF